MGLTGPSRTVIVEPLEEKDPMPEPAETPEVAPEIEREREKVPA